MTLNGFATMYHRSHDNGRNENDHYATAPWVTYALMKTDGHNIPNTIWEPACGNGWMVKELEKHDRNVIATDLYSYDFNRCVTGIDFLQTEKQEGEPTTAIITNPPYAKNLAEAFIRHAVQVHQKPYVAVICRLAFMESQGRYKMFTEIPPSRVFVLSTRFSADEKRFLTEPEAGGMIPYAWYVWDKKHVGPTELKWIDGKEMFRQWKEREAPTQTLGNFFA